MNSTCQICGSTYSLQDEGVAPSLCKMCVMKFMGAVDFEIRIKEILSSCYSDKSHTDNLRAEVVNANLNNDLLGQILWSWNCHNINENDLSFRFLESLDIPEIDSAIKHIRQVSSAIKFNELLSKTTGERSVAAELDMNHRVLRSATGYCHEGEAAYCFKEFRFGADFVADFVILTPRRSLPPLVNLVELEPVDDPVFTRKGTPSSRLLGAVNQIKQWKDWVTKNHDLFLSELNKRSNQSIDPLTLHGWMRSGRIEAQSFIFIGRRSSMNPEYRSLWNSPDERLTIHSYDTFVDVMIGHDIDALGYKGNLTHGMN